jgi:hypothetical protein
MWATERESRSDVIDRYRRVWEHSDATVDALTLDATGRVAWWQDAEVPLFNILVHLLAETSRHAGHADIVRETIDGAAGRRPGDPNMDPGYDWAAHVARVEAAASRWG